MRATLVKWIRRLALGYAALFAADLVLFWVGNVSDFQLPSAVWGTYSSWASAMLPGLTLFGTAAMWLADRNRRDEAELQAELFRVRVESRNGGAWLVNDSSSAVALVSLMVGGRNLAREAWVRTGGDLFLDEAESFEAARVVVLGTTCVVPLERPAVPA